MNTVRLKSWNQVHNVGISLSGKTFNVAIGEVPIDSITATQILEVCRLYERQGKTDSAKRMRSKASQVFRYAIALGLCQFNVADQISGTLKVVKLSIERLLLMSKKLRQLLKSINTHAGRGDIAIDYAGQNLPMYLCVLEN